MIGDEHAIGPHRRKTPSEIRPDFPRRTQAGRIIAGVADKGDGLGTEGIGQLQKANVVSSSTWVGAGALFFVAMGLLGASWKVIARFAENEAAEAYIRKEFGK